MYNLSTKILTVENSATWEKILKIIKDQISSANFRTWFSQTQVLELTRDSLKLVVPSAFAKTNLSSRFERNIKEAAAQVLEHEISITYEIDSSKFSKISAPSEEDGLPFNLAQVTPNAPNPTLNPKYTIDNFVVGLTNNLGFAAAQAVVASPGTSYNPLFIYGPSGVGKTHLMHAIGNALHQKNLHLKLVYASSERFMVDFVDAIQTKKTSEFRAKYRNCDLLLVDDIQFISGKDSTQEEFFHTFNEIYAKGAQVVLTSDRPPNEIQKLETRLSSRFQGGLMVDIQLPDFDTRVAILRAKLAEKGDFLPEECLNAIAGAVESNTRELEGKLIQILSMIKLSNQEPSLENIRRFLGNKQSAAAHQRLDHKKVLGAVNAYFNIRMADLTGPRRQKELVVPRQIAMYILYADCKLPFERIGQMLGGRDHTTILHGVRKMEEVVQRDREIQRLVFEVKQSLG